MQTLKIDAEFKALIPAMSVDEYNGLEQSLRTEGCRDALVVWGEILIDGHNRYEICQKHGIVFKTVGMDFKDRTEAKIWIIRNQFSRRNLSDYVRAQLALSLKGFFSEKAKENQHEGINQHSLCQKSDKPSIDTKKELAQIAGVSHDTIAKVERIERQATPELKQAITDKKVSINSAVTISEMPENEQTEIVAKGVKEILAKASEIRASKAIERKEKQIKREKKYLEEALPCPHKMIKLTSEQDVIQCNALITDPPYGILSESWEPENLEKFTIEWATRWNQCGADTLSIFWSQRYLWEGRKWFDSAFSNYDFQQLLVWVYRNNKSPQSRKGFKQTWEPIYFYRRKDSARQISIGAGQWGEDCHDMDSHIAAVPQSNFNDENMKVHPAQKPVSVMTWLINATTEISEIIADPFCGSGTTGIAALRLKRQFHGIEIDSEMIKIAERRLNCYGLR